MFDLDFDPNAAPTIEALRAAIKKVFPGVETETRPYMGGEIVRAKIWQYHLEFDLTATPLAYSGKAGAVRMQFKWVPPEGKNIILDHGNTERMEPVRAFAFRTRAYLDGITAAISMACEEEGEEPIADLV